MLQGGLEEFQRHPDEFALEPSIFMRHPSEVATASLRGRRALLRTRRDASREATETIGARRGARHTRKGSVVMGIDALGLRMAAFGARRAAFRFGVDTRVLRSASLRAGTEAPFIPTDALPTRRGTFVSTDGCSTSSQGHRRRSKGCPTRTLERPARNGGRFARSSGCSCDSRGRRPKTRTGFAKSHAIHAHFSPCPPHLGGSRADARSGPHDARRRFTRTLERHRWDSRCQTTRGRRPP